jgi:hypothetical protein
VDFSSDLFYEVGCSSECPTCCEEVIDDSHLIAWSDSIGLDLDRIISVFERVINSDSTTWEFPLLAYHDEWFTKYLCYTSSKYESSSIEPCDDIGTICLSSHLITCISECLWMSEKWGYVTKEDSRFWEIRILSDIVSEVDIWEILFCT